MRVVVTGGSGLFGRAVVPQLAAQGLTAVPVGRATGFDLAAGTGLTAALAGADVVVHAASDPRRAREVDVAGTRRLVEAARRAGVGHLLHLSIVGVDRLPVRYYRAKYAAEREVTASGLPWTVVRSTQWFPLVTRQAEALGRWWVAPRDVAIAPSDVEECARLVTRRVLAGATGTVVEFAGPERLPVTRLVKQVTGHPVLHVHLPGRLGRALRDGALLPAGPAELGARGWTAWLRTHAPAPAT